MGREHYPQSLDSLPAGKLTGPRHSVRSEFLAPPPQFAGCFTTFYKMELDVADGGVVEDHLQPEWANLRFFGGAVPTSQIGSQTLSDARFSATGPSSLPCKFSLGTSRMWGIGILPLGWARLFEADAFDLANTIADGSRHEAFAKFDCLSDILCDPQADHDAQMAAITATMERLMQPSRDEAKIIRVHEALVNGDHATVADLADACAMSIRTLERVCRRYFGFTPKRLMRRQRFMRSLTSFMLRTGSGGDVRWTEAMDGGYHDQAQFTREFSEFMTMTPSKYASLDHPILASFMEARARIWGSAAQTLDKPTRSGD